MMWEVRRMNTTIRKDDLIESIADAFQFISHFHPPDFIEALAHAHANEEGAAAKDAIGQILVNARMCAIGRRPICQDTGIAVVFLKVGMNVQWDTDQSIQEMVDEGVRRAYRADNNPLRASVVADPLGRRRNTGDNTPAIVHYEIVPGD
jgi:fumarate hydratase class I